MSAQFRTEMLRFDSYWRAFGDLLSGNEMCIFTNVYAVGTNVCERRRNLSVRVRFPYAQSTVLTGTFPPSEGEQATSAAWRLAEGIDPQV
jgi:hypothetical protein